MNIINVCKIFIEKSCGNLLKDLIDKKSHYCKEVYFPPICQVYVCMYFDKLVLIFSLKQRSRNSDGHPEEKSQIGGSNTLLGGNINCMTPLENSSVLV